MATTERPKARWSSPVVRYVLQRLLFIPAGAVIVATFSFFLVNLVPSDPIGALLGDFASPEDIERVREQLGLNEPILNRYIAFLLGVLQGDLGASYYSQAAVVQSISIRLTSSALLITFGLGVAWGLGVVQGAIGAIFQGTLIDRIAGAWVSLVQALPAYVAGLLGLFVFFYLLGWLPAPTGQLSLGVTKPPPATGAALIDTALVGDMVGVGNALAHLVLPVAALGVANSVVFARITRTTLAAALDSPFSEFSRARGLSRYTVVVQAFNASKISLLTYVAAVISGLLGGTAFVETIFNWQGLGQWAVQGLLSNDLPVIQGFVLLSGLLTLAAYVVADLLILRADPRIRRPFMGAS